MTAQLDLFALPALRIVPSTFAGPHMRAIVAEVVAAGWDWGALDDFAKEHYGIDEETICCGRTWFCHTYHQAPEPNAAAFMSWLPKAEDDIARCAWYRASFAWVVAMSLDHLLELREETLVDFALDETGAIVAPDDYRPEDALRVGARHDGLTITRVATSREPRTYMDRPDWYPTKFFDKGALRGKEYRHVEFPGLIVAWIEGMK